MATSYDWAIWTPDEDITECGRAKAAGTKQAGSRGCLAIVENTAPGLTTRYGVGPVSAAQVIVSFSHPGRCRSEAAFAALGGTSPIPASSGTRHTGTRRR